MADVLSACEHLLASGRFGDLTLEDIARATKIQVGSLCHFWSCPPARRLALIAAAGALCAGLFGAPPQLAAQALAQTKPEESGLSPEGLAKISDWMRAEVAARKIPGAVIMIVRKGKLAFVDVAGQRDPANSAAMKADDIFRIYSMTKPITSVAAMMLVEAGKLDLDAPVARYIPAFGQLKLGVEKTDASGGKTLRLVDADRPMTVRDLMRHTSGLTYGAFGTGLVKQAYRGANINVAGNISNAQFAELIARMPLAYVPGSTWDYSHATDLFVVYMMQSPKQRGPHHAALRELVYGALTDAKVACGP